MAGYYNSGSHPQYGGSSYQHYHHSPPQQSPPTMAYTAYNPPAASYSYQHQYPADARAPSAFQLEPQTPILDQDQMNYFWNEVNNGHIPSNLPGTSQTQTSFSHPALQQYQPFGGQQHGYYPSYQSQHGSQQSLAPPPPANPYLHHEPFARPGASGDSSIPGLQMGPEILGDGEEEEYAPPDISMHGALDGRAPLASDNGPKAKDKSSVPSAAPEATPDPRRINLFKPLSHYDEVPPSLKQKEIQAAKTPPPTAPKIGLKRKACEAIKDFHRHGIRFSQLAKEPGFDESDESILRELYTQSDIPLDSPPKKMVAVDDSGERIARLREMLGSAGFNNIDDEILARLTQANSEPKPSAATQAGAAISGGGVVESTPKPNTPPQPASRAMPAAETTVMEVANKDGTNAGRDSYLAKLRAMKSKNIPAVAVSAPLPVSAHSPQSMDSSHNPVNLPGLPNPTPRKPLLINRDIMQKKMQALRAAQARQAASAATTSEPPQPAGRAASVSSINYESGRASALSNSDAERTQEEAESTQAPDEDLEEGEVSETAETKAPTAAAQLTTVKPEAEQPKAEQKAEQKATAGSAVSQTSQEKSLPTTSTSSQQTQPGMSLKRSARSAFGVSRGGPAKRSYPPRRFQEAPEPLVIDITSDEDSDDSDGEADGASLQAQSSAQSKAARHPPAAASNADQYHSPSSAISTPQGTFIPDPIAAEQAKRKAELASKKAELQRLIQLQENRKLETTNSSPIAPNGVRAAPSSMPPAARTVAEHSQDTPLLGSTAIARSVSSPSHSPFRASSVAQQTALSAIDDSIRSDQDELSILQQQVRRIQENIARKAAEKQALAAELTSLGVNSEGMSEARMQQVRDDILEQQYEAQAPATQITEEKLDADVNTDSEVADDEATPIEDRPAAGEARDSSNEENSSYEENEGDSGEDGEILEDLGDPRLDGDAAQPEPQPIARATLERRPAGVAQVKFGAHKTPVAPAQQSVQTPDVPSPCLKINEDAQNRGFCLKLTNIDPDVDRFTLRKWMRGLPVVGLIHERPPKRKGSKAQPGSAVVEFASMEEALQMLPELRSRPFRNKMMQVTHLGSRKPKSAPTANSAHAQVATHEAHKSAAQSTPANVQNNVHDASQGEDNFIGEADDARALASSARVRISGVPHNASKQDVRKFLIDYAITGITQMPIRHSSAASAERDVLVDFLYPRQAENASQQVSNGLLLGKRVQVSVITPTPQDVAAAEAAQSLEHDSDGRDAETDESEDSDDGQDYKPDRRALHPPVFEHAAQGQRQTEVVPTAASSADAQAGKTIEASSDEASADDGEVTEDQASRFLEQQAAAIENTSDDDSSEADANDSEAESPTDDRSRTDAGVLLHQPAPVESGEEIADVQDGSESGPSEAPERSDDEDGNTEDPSVEAILQADSDDGSEEDSVDSESGDVYEPLDAVNPQNPTAVRRDTERSTVNHQNSDLGAEQIFAQHLSQSAGAAAVQGVSEVEDEDDDLYEPDQATGAATSMAYQTMLDGAGDEDDYDPEFAVAMHEAFADPGKPSHVGEDTEAVKESSEATQPGRKMSGGIPGLGSEAMEISEGETVSEAEPHLSGPADVPSKSFVPSSADLPIGAEPYNTNTTSHMPASDARSSDSHTISHQRVDTGSTTFSESGYVPYESPLKCFKAYKYSPAFRQTVKGRFTSLTYSNKLNPNQLLCSTELHSGECTNPQCPFQHFRDITLTGQDVIRLIGTLDQTNSSKEDKQRWAAGIRGVIDELRKEGINDMETIAERVVAYRRAFFGGSILDMINPAQRAGPAESPSEGEISG